MEGVFWTFLLLLLAVASHPIDASKKWCSAFFEDIELWREIEAEVSYVDQDSGREKVSSNTSIVSRKQLGETSLNLRNILGSC